jgi:DNA-binding LacI/PurR family transcriptional regulator
MAFRYEEITADMERRLETGEWEPGMKLPPEEELARDFSVARETIRKALEPLKECGHIVGERGRGTFVSDVGADKSQTIHALYVGRTESHFHRDQFLALIAEAQLHRTELFAFDPYANGETDIAAELGPRLGAVDWLIAEMEDPDPLCPILEGEEANVIQLGYKKVDLPCPAYHVLVDYGRAVERAVDYLVGLGHRRIALLTPEGATDWERVNAYPELHKPYYRAFRGALAGNCIEEDGSLALITTTDKSEDVGRLRAVLEDPDRPTAFVCDSDFRARLLYEAAMQERLQIPQDLSVIGINDTPWCQALIPELTSVNVGEREVARLVMALCEKGVPTEELVTRVEPNVVERESCLRKE